jgi:endonuclease YncB( thermonuclease family)
MKPWDLPVTDVLRVVDGDTIRVRVDCGFRVDARPTVRLTIVDTPERGQPGWLEAQDFVRDWLLAPEWLLLERPIVRLNLRLTTYGKATFDRWLGDIYDASTGDTLSGALLQAGYARYQL